MGPAQQIEKKAPSSWLEISGWQLIAGPEMEEETWKLFRKHANLDDDSLQLIKDLYFGKMKVVVSDEHLAALRRRYLAGHGE